MGPAGTTAIAFGATCFLAPVMLALLRRRAVLDHPSERSSHTVPTPRGLGLGLAVAALVALAISDAGGSATIALAVGAGGFAVLGAIEDLRGVRPGPRFIAQAAIASLTLPWLLEDSGLIGALHAIALVATVLWMVAFVNAFNFMDGINGISVAEGAVAGASFVIVGSAQHVHFLVIAGAILAATCVGFAPMNFPRARGFMGDAGSYFFGGWIAMCIVVALRVHIPVEAAAGATIIYVADTSLTLVNRIRAGERWWEPHRSHVYQRLTAAGWSHEATTGLVAVAALLCAALGSLSIDASRGQRTVADVLIAVIVVAYLLAPRFVRARKVYR